MKSFFVSCFFLLTCFVYSFGQVPNRISKIVESRYDPNFPDDDFVITYEKTYEYDRHGNIQLEREIGYDFSGTFFDIFGIFYEYNSSNLLQKKIYRRYNSDVDLYITTSWTDFKYDDKGCLVEEIRTSNRAFIGTHEKILYERDQDCNALKEVILVKRPGDLDFEIRKIYEREFQDDGILYKQKYFQWSYSDSLLVQKYEKTYLHNEYKNLKSVRTAYFNYHPNSDTSSFIKTSYDYDSYQNLIHEQNQYRQYGNSDWITTDEYFYQNIYDERYFLVETLINSLEYNGAISYPGFYDGSKNYYDYTCKESETLKTHHNNYSGFKYKTETFYEGEDPCFEVKNADLKLSIFPNPTSGFLTIESPILQSGNTQVSIFSTDGKVLLQKTEFKRSEQTSLDLGSDLQNGFYFVQLKNQDYQLIEKLIVQR